MRIDLENCLRVIKNDIKYDWIGIRFVQEKTTQRIVRNGQVEKNRVNLDRGVMVELLLDGHFAYAGTNLVTLEGIKNAARHAQKLAEITGPYKIHHFSERVRGSVKGSYLGPHQMGPDALSAGEILDRLIRVDQGLKIDPRIIETQVAAMFVEAEMEMVSSNHSQISQRSFKTGSNILVTGKEGSEIQTRTSGSLSKVLQRGYENLELTDLQLEAEVLTRELLELLQAPNCPSDNRDLLIAPDQLYLQVHESIGHPLELDRILGDERNYAGHSFIKLEDFGKLQYGSPLLNVTFDPAADGQLASYSFDDTGNEAQKEYIIKDGVLLRGLGGMESQLRSGVPGVSCQRASSWNRPPIDRMANLNIEPGTSSLQDMIAATEKGIFMKTNRSWSIDDYRNKFQFGCEYGQLIEDGQLTKVVKNPNYRGVTTPFWNKLKMVGNQETFQQWGTPFCGKGEPNQMIRVGHSTPACLFSNVDIFGGAL